MAALPWALFLLGFGLCLSVLRHRRAARAAAPPGDPGAAPWWPWAAEPGTADAAAPLPARPEQASGGADPGTADDMLPARPEPASSGAE